MPKLSTQDFLEFSQIKDGVIILKNRGLRIILMVSSLNFALKSEDEQNAIIYQFQNFLNSLDFSCQILIQSRRLNMAGYIDKLKKIEEKEKNELLKIQIAEYKNFIEKMMSGGTIMQKTFYAVVPFSIEEILPGKFTSKKGELPKFSRILTEEEFQRAKIQILQRAEFIALGLRGCGLQSVALNNLEITELLWSLHHPQEAERGYYPEIPLELVE